MKISPLFFFFFAETLAELAAVVLHTRMYTDVCLNNVYTTQTADKNNTRAVYHQSHLLGLVMEELERNPPAVTPEVPAFPTWVVGEQGFWLPCIQRWGEWSQAAAPVLRMCASLLDSAGCPQLCRRRMFSKTMLLPWHQRRDGCPQETGPSQRAPPWSQGCLSTCRTS